MDDLNRLYEDHGYKDPLYLGRPEAVKPVVTCAVFIFITSANHCALHSKGFVANC